jgi:hypothetical protein
MNTIIKTAGIGTAVLLSLLAPGTTTAASPAAPPARAEVVRECRQSPTLVEEWARHGQPLPPCVVEHNLLVRHFADDRRQPAH